MKKTTIAFLIGTFICFFSGFLSLKGISVYQTDSFDGRSYLFLGAMISVFSLLCLEHMTSFGRGTLFVFNIVAWVYMLLMFENGYWAKSNVVDGIVATFWASAVATGFYRSLRFFDKRLE